jgi:hypothetical protein
MTTSRLVIASLVLFLSPTVQVAATIDPILRCTPVMHNSTTVFEACASAQYNTTSPAVYPNGTTVYMGGYDSIYTFYTGLNSGFNTSTLSPAKLQAASAHVVVFVRLEDNNTCTINVTLSGVEKSCGFCSYCGKDDYTADCTNIANGRRVNCESAAIGTAVYFPLNATALGPGVTFVTATIPPIGANETSAPATSPSRPKTATSGASKNGHLIMALVGGVMSLLRVF